MYCGPRVGRKGIAGVSRCAPILVYTGIGFKKMETRKTANDDAMDAQSYYERRTQDLSRKLLDMVTDLFSEDASRHCQEFEEQVERRLRNGAKFVPRKRQPR